MNIRRLKKMRKADFYCSDCGTKLLYKGNYFYCQKCKNGIFCDIKSFSKPLEGLDLTNKNLEIVVNNILPEDAYAFC